MSFAKSKDWYNYRSIRFRLTGLFIAILGSTLVLFGAILYSAFVRNDQKEFDIALYNHAVDLAQTIEIDPFGGLLVQGDLHSAHNKIVPFAVGSSFVQILNPEGNIVARSRILGKRDLPVFAEDLRQVWRSGAVFRTIDGKQIGLSGKTAGRYRMVSYVAQSNPSGPFLLQVAVPTSLLDQSAKSLIILLVLGIPLALVVAAFGGLYWSGRALKPVTDIIEKAKGIHPARLSERVPVPPADDELRHLSLTLNELLDRLQRAFENQERFIADASHELKTPLAILKGELDLMRSRPRSPEEVADFVKSASQELDHLCRVVEDLLLLARVDAGAASLSVQPVRLDEVLLDVVSRLDMIARKKNVKLRFDLAESLPDSNEAFGLQGDPDLLRSLFKNLIENAIKFSPEGETVEVRLTDTGGFLEVMVRDRGTGIASDVLPKIFERFYRSTDPKNPVPGAGLGLAIARRIAQAHRGEVEAASRTEGADRGTTLSARFERH